MQFAFEGFKGAEVIYDDLLLWGKEESHDRALRDVQFLREPERKVLS